MNIILLCLNFAAIILTVRLIGNRTHFHTIFQGAEVRMYYECIALGCGKCNTTPLHASLQNTTMYTASYHLLHYS